MIKMEPQIFYAEMDSPIGPLTIVASEKGVCCIEFGSISDVQPTLTKWLKKHLQTNELTNRPEALTTAIIELTEYFNGNRKNFSFELDLYGTPFQKKVWQELLNIEYGSTKSYKDVSQAISAPKAVRAVGTAIGRNPVPIVVPCHRVIGSDGTLVGFSGGLDKKEKLLVIEKVLEKTS